MIGEGLAQGGDGLGTVAHHITHLLIGDHADVRLAGAGILVQVLVQGRQRLQCLGGNSPFGGEHGQFAGLGGNHTTLDEQVVTQVNQLLELLKGISADLLLGNHALNLGAIASGKLHEAQATGVTQEEYATGDADHVFGFISGFKLAVILGANLFNGGGDVESHRVRLNAVLKHHGTLGHAHLHLLRMRQRAEFLIARINGFIQGSAVIDLGVDSRILLQQHFGTFHRGHSGNGSLFILIFLRFDGLTHKPTVYREATTPHATRRICIT